MIRVAATVTAFALLAVVSADAQSLIISRGGSRPVRAAPPQNFTGSVQVAESVHRVRPSTPGVGKPEADRARLPAGGGPST